MGGEVKCSSVVGEGTEFKINLNTNCIQMINFLPMDDTTNYVIINKAANETELKST